MCAAEALGRVGVYSMVQGEKGRLIGLGRAPNPAITHPLEPKLGKTMQVGRQTCHLGGSHCFCPPVPSSSGS